MNEPECVELNELREFLEHHLQYPATVDAVRTDVGGVGVAAPDETDTRTVADLLDRVDAQTYASADELLEALLSHLPDAYVGRKYYDDRSGGGDAASVRVDETDQSL